MSSPDPLTELIQRVERHVDHECETLGRYTFMEEVRVIAGDLRAAPPDHRLREALERIARSSRQEGGRCVWCGNASLATYHADDCPKEIARAALSEATPSPEATPDAS